jgi:hypothetical protein
MNFIVKALKPTSIFLAIFFLLAPGYYQSVSAAMIGTQTMLKPDRSQNTRDYLHGLISREDIQKVLVARGIDPQEAKARIDSLSDDELEMISDNCAALPAGGDGTGFAVVVTMVIMIIAILVEYFSEVKMVPELHSDE